MLASHFIQKGHILIATDNSHDIYSLNLLLQKQNYQVSVARNLSQYHQIIASNVPDIVLIPPIFEKKYTKKICEQLHNQPQTAHVMVLYLVTINALKKDNLFVHVSDYLLKPFNYKEVIKRLDNYNKLSQLLKKVPAITAGETLDDYTLTNTAKIEQTLTSLLIENQSLKQNSSTMDFNQISALEEKIEAKELTITKLNEMYECFVPRDFLEHLGKKNIVELQAGDQIQKIMSIIFLDIRDFTSLSEKMTPQENFNFLNEYLSYISPVVRQHGGFIDKYIGDAIMALFPDKPENALKAAIGIRQALTEFNMQRRINDTAVITQGIGQVNKKNQQKPISIGIGIHTGSMILGVIGEKGRMQSTVISDAVNLASRLEGLTKMYGASIIISLQSLNEIDKNQYKYRYIGRIQVKGKKKPVTVFEIFDGDSPAILKLKLKTCPIFVKAMENYQDKKVGEAITLFRQVLNQNPDDKAAKLYLHRASSLASLSDAELAQWQPIEVLNKK